MSKKRKKEASSGFELLESPEALGEGLSRVEQQIEKYKVLILSAVGAVAIAVAAYFGIQILKENQDEKAQKLMFQAQFYFESDSLDLALQGDGNNYGFLSIIDEFSWSNASNTAHLYSGIIYLKKAQYQKAISHLKSYSADDPITPGRSYALIGDAYMELNDYSLAANYYGKAASYKPNKFLTPDYLMKKALANEMAGNMDKAIGDYDKIINKYAQSIVLPDAKKYKAKLETQKMR